jgi:D-alanine-D-alanine ligase
MISFGKVAVLMGGASAEREVSLKSGTRVLAALRGKGVDAHGVDPVDGGLQNLLRGGYQRAFLALHGGDGENGTVQGVLEWLRIPYTGSGVLGSALAMDKLRTKLIWQALGLPTPAFEVLEPNKEFGEVATRIGLPLMVKPASEGSSIGMSKVTAADALEPAFREAVRYDRRVIAERFVDGHELTVGILAERSLPVIRLETTREFYDYQAKYIDDDTRYFIPSGLDSFKEERVQKLAIEAFKALGCRGWGRVDLMIDRSGSPYLLEVNTAPGMTDHSLVPMAARATGIPFEDLCVHILGDAHVG